MCLPGLRPRQPTRRIQQAGLPGERVGVVTAVISAATCGWIARRPTYLLSVYNGVVIHKVSTATPVDQLDLDVRDHHESVR